MTKFELAIFFLEYDYRNYLIQSEEFFGAPISFADDIVCSIKEIINKQGVEYLYSLVESDNYFTEIFDIFSENND